ncbi:dopamine receptor D2b isoform X1 [Silurus meridionalis]|uniref:dopamine receptor D2b isoform X1 n=1 Tax=Silurus meridionalis TaxID=175797 RepID=UPI001EEC8E1A|nr:dopamine receptor D2b isoform X1 [Silurus meridionalis]
MDFLVEYGLNETHRDNTSEAFNGTDVEAKHQYNYYAMLLTLLIFVIVFGNVLVCMAVSREKALQTTTNYLIVSLAVADLLVATLVMPWVVYLEVVGEWRFSKIHCDIFVTLDVMMCTASILNLCAISIDRYTAVAMPLLYNTRYSSKRRVTVMISVVWVLSFAISCPLLFGLNNTGDGFFLSTRESSDTRRRRMRDRQPGLCGLLVHHVFLRALYHHPSGLRADLRGSAQASETSEHQAQLPEDGSRASASSQGKVHSPGGCKTLHSHCKDQREHACQKQENTGDKGGDAAGQQCGGGPNGQPQSAGKAEAGTRCSRLHDGQSESRSSFARRVAAWKRREERPCQRHADAGGSQSFRNTDPVQRQDTHQRHQAHEQEKDVTAQGEEGHPDARHCSRSFHHLLAALLHHSHPKDPLCELLRASGNVQRLHVARIREQRREPHHIHHFQRGVPQGFHEDPALLSALCVSVRLVPSFSPLSEVEDFFFFFF